MLYANIIIIFPKNGIPSNIAVQPCENRLTNILICNYSPKPEKFPIEKPLANTIQVCLSAIPKMQQNHPCYHSIVTKPPANMSNESKMIWSFPKAINWSNYSIHARFTHLNLRSGARSEPWMATGQHRATTRNRWSAVYPVTPFSIKA